jgi:hypothetical protein
MKKKVTEKRNNMRKTLNHSPLVPRVLAGSLRSFPVFFWYPLPAKSPTQIPVTFPHYLFFINALFYPFFTTYFDCSTRTRKRLWKKKLTITHPFSFVNIYLYGLLTPSFPKRKHIWWLNFDFPPIVWKEYFLI